MRKHTGPEKKCTRCGLVKPTSEFGKRSNRNSVTSDCKPCRNKVKKAWKEAHPERYKEFTKKYEETHKEQILAKVTRYRSTQKGKEVHRTAVKKFRENNPEKVSEHNKRYKHLRSAWKKKNKHAVRATQAKRRAAELKATPPWVDKEHLEEIKKIYKSALILAEFHEEPYHVDHIEPLQGKTSCGLHVFWNLRPIPARENLSKHNKLLTT